MKNWNGLKCTLGPFFIAVDGPQFCLDRIFVLASFVLIDSKMYTRRYVELPFWTLDRPYDKSAIFAML